MRYFTTLSVANWAEYGQWTLPTWERLDRPVTLILDDPAAAAVSEFAAASRGWLETRPIDPRAVDFQRRIPADKLAAKWNGDGSYNYRFDIAKFAWPAFVFCQALRQLPAPFVWMDADVLVKTPPPRAAILPPGAEVTFLHRTHEPPEHPYTETGLLGFDLPPARAALLAATMERILEGGEVYELAQWHDCTVFDAARARLAAEIRFVSIARDPTRNHVFDHTLSEWLHHYRGPTRKQTARDGDTTTAAD
jgi:hypothetical protein